MGGLERSDRSVVPWGQSKDLQFPWVFARSCAVQLGGTFSAIRLGKRTFALVKKKDIGGPSTPFGR